MMPQSSSLTINGECKVDRILRFESLAAHWSILATEFRLPTKLPRLNATQHPDYRECYDQSGLDLVISWYPTDFTQLNYPLNLE